MNSILRNLIIIVIIGFVQVIIINVLFWTNDTSVEAMGGRISVLGSKNVVISPPAGMVYVENEDSLKRYEIEGLVFVLKGDLNHPDKPIVFADIWRMGEINSLEKLSKTIEQESEAEVLFSRIQGSSLNVIRLDGLTVDDSAFTYYRFMSAYPYYLRLSCSYGGTMYPTDEVLETLKAVRLKQK